MNKYWWKRHQKKILIALAAILMLSGIFLRLWNFSPWLHFELDQARDAIVVSDALEKGPGELPLLGPKAAGTMLRLGPVFYYLQYLSGLIFGNNPAGIALIFIFFSVGSIVLVFLLLRRYFSVWASLVGMTIFSFSAFQVIYARFAWNPNQIPFFVLLAFYALLRAFDDEEKRKKMWFITAFAGAAIASQLHFLVFVVLLPLMAVILVLRRPKLSWKTYVLAIAVVFVLFSPVFVNELKTGGANSKEFYKAVFKKSQKDDDHSLGEKIVKSYTEMARGTGLLVFGKANADFYSVSIPASKTDGFLSCGEKCKRGIFWGWINFLFFSTGIFAAIWMFIVTKNKTKKTFYLIFAAWTLAIFILFIPLAFDLSPRFFLLLSPTVVLLVASISETAKKVKLRKIILPVLAVIVIITNLQALIERFDQYAKANSEAVDVLSDKFLKEKTRVTLEQQKEIAAYMIDEYNKNKFPIYLNSDPQYRRALLFHIRQRKIRYEDLRNARVYEQGNYFLVYPTNSNLQDATERYLDRFDIAQTKKFGTLTLFHLKPKTEKIEEKAQIFVDAPQQMQYIKGTPERFTWNEIFSKKSLSEQEAPDEELIN